MFSFCCCYCCWVTKSCLTLCDPMDSSIPSFFVPHHLLEFAEVRVHWVGDAIETISSSASPFSSCLQSFPRSRSFLTSQLFPSCGQSTGASALASVLPKCIQGWFPLGFTGLISLLSKGPSGVFSSNTVQKQQFFSPLPSLLSNSHTHTWPPVELYLMHVLNSKQSNFSLFIPWL